MDVQKISIAGHSVPAVAVERQEDGMFVPSGTNATQEVDSSLLTGLLGRLTTLQAVSHVTYDPRDLTGYGLDQPAVTVHLGLSGTNQLGRVLLIGEKAEGGYYSMVQGRDVVFLLEESVVSAFTNNLFIDPEGVLPDSE